MAGIQWEVSETRWMAFGIAAAAICAAAVGTALLAGRRAGPTAWSFLRQLVSGADGRPSTSKWQAAVWTAIALFGFVEVFIERLLLGISTGDPSIPTHLLLAMGLSMTTMTAAKGITVAYVEKNLVNKEGGGAPGGAAMPGGLVTDDGGTPDLSKLQMVAFTVLAILVYLLRLAFQEGSEPELVDIEPALMVLMGMSQGAYLGKKLTTKSSPRITGVSPAMGQAGDPIAVIGTSFGDDPDGGIVYLDHVPVLGVTAWTDRRIEVQLPAERAPSVPWQDGDRVTVRVVANGSEATALGHLVYRKAASAAVAAPTP